MSIRPGVSCGPSSGSRVLVLFDTDPIATIQSNSILIVLAVLKPVMACGIRVVQIGQQAQNGGGRCYQESGNLI